METEKGFREEFFFLSNFFRAPTTATIAGVEGVFPTGEHLFQAYKVESSVLQYAQETWVRKFIEAPTPGKAKYFGRAIPLNVALWDERAFVCMKRTLWAKFEQHPELKTQLLETKDLVLVEYNDWGDTKWGVNQKTGVGENLLGQLLMRLRTYYENN